MTAELRRNLVLAILGLFMGLGLVAALFGGGAYLKHASPTATPSSETGSGRVGAVSPDADHAGGTSAGPAEVTDGSGRRADLASPPAAARSESGAADPNALRFDIVRVEPNGEAVVAGRGAPNAVVDLLVDGRAVARALADPNGQFAIVPPRLPTGNSEILLRSTDAEGRETRSKDSVAVAVSKSREGKPLVALTSPDKPTVVLSQPEATAQVKPGTPDGRQAVLGQDPAGQKASAEPGSAKAPSAKARSSPAPGKPTTEAAASDGAKAAPVTIVSVDAQEGGRLFVTGQAPPGATVRLYLNDTLIAPASVGRDGKVTFTIGRGVKPGSYKVRIDQVDAVSGKVRSRAEVPFSLPEPARVAALDSTVDKAASPGAAALGEAETPQRHAAAPGVAPPASPSSEAKAQAIVRHPAPGDGTPAAVEPQKPTPGSVFVAEVGTAKIIRGDSLWQISRRTYGKGDRYTVIYDANQQQIRNPDRIYPGQIFVLPGEEAGRAKRG